jgi:hypothetical protein
MPDSLTFRDGELNSANTVVRGVRQVRTRPGWLSSEIGGTAVWGDPTDRWNAITDLGMSGDPRLYETSVNIPSGATQVILTGNTKEIANGFPDTYPLSIYPLAIPQKQTFRVGQDIRIPDGKAANVDLVATITSVVGNVLTFTPATTNTNAIDFIQHDDTRVLQEFLDTFLSGYIYFPEGFYPISSHQAYVAGKDYAIQIPATSEALNRQFVFEGLGKYRSGFLHTGPGHAFKLKNTSINNLVFRNLHCSHANRYQLQTLESTSAGVGLLLASNQYNSEGVPQSTATACLIENCIFIGWKYGIFADNLQSSIIQQNSFYFCNNSIHLIATGNVRGIGSQTEPNANQLDKNFIQYAVVLPSNAGRTVTDAVTDGAHNPAGVLVDVASNIVTSATAAFVSTDLYRLVKIISASVNQSEHWAMIIEVVNSTTIKLSQPPWIADTGLTMTLFPRSFAHVALQNASNIGIDGGTWQGNWAGQNAEVHGLYAANLDELTVSRLWQEESGGGGGSAMRYTNVRSLTITNCNANANSGTEGYGNCLYLDGVVGAFINSSYFNSSGTATDIEYRNGTRGVFIDNTTFTSPTNLVDGNTGDTTQNFYPIQLGQGVRFINSSPAWGNENLRDTFIQRNLLTNGNFQEGLTGWTADKPLALTATNTGTARGLRYITVSPSTVAAQAYVKQLHQTYTLPDSIQQYQPVTLGFDWYIQSRGADAIAVAPFYNEMRVTLLWGTGETVQYNINPSASNGRISARWNRASLQTRIPSSGAGRTLEVYIECAEGANAAIFRIANFKVTLSTRATFDDDESITELNGGNLSAPMRWIDQTTPSNPAAGSIKIYSKGEAPTYLTSAGAEMTLVTSSGITSLNALTGAAQTFTNDTNVTIVSAGTAHVITWAGTLSKARQNATTVYTDQANTWSTGNQQFNDLRIIPSAGAFYMRIAPTGPYTATRTLTVQLNDGSRTLSMAGNVTFSNALSLANTTGNITLGSGSNNLTLTTTANTSVTLPTSGTLFSSTNNVTPDADNTRAIGTALLRYSDVYGVTFYSTNLNASGGLFLNSLSAMGHSAGVLEIGVGYTANGTKVFGGSNSFSIDGTGNVLLGSGSSTLATNATDGFVFIPGGTGTPTGTPSISPTGIYPMYYDATNNKLYVRNGGTWRSITLT